MRILREFFFEGPNFDENGRKLKVLGRTWVKRQMDRVYLAPGARVKASTPGSNLCEKH